MNPSPRSGYWEKGATGPDNICESQLVAYTRGRLRADRDNVVSVGGAFLMD